MDSYFESMDSVSKARYREKIAVIGNKDPYTINKENWNSDPSRFPDLNYAKLVNYLIFQPSPFYTLKDFENYKSLEAYDRFVSGWVRDVHVYIHRDVASGKMPIHVVKARVMHSQSLNEKSLTPWIMIYEDGKVISAHCDCKAGLGESCSHIASVLFYVDAAVRVRETTTVTQKPAYWLLPASRTGVEYAPLKDIDFTSARTLKNKLDESIRQQNNEEPTKQKIAPEVDVKKPSDAKWRNFFEKIRVDKPACLSVDRRYSTDYVPLHQQPQYPLILSELYDEKFSSSTFEEVSEHCEALVKKITVSEDELQNVESATREQANSRIWFRFRTGRITASKMKSVCSTSCENPSMSLLKAICYPTERPFSNTATRWGCDHEKTAREKYEELHSNSHVNSRIEDCGLFLSTEYPFMGASPDGIISCDCCGTGCIEIKCPYCLKDAKIEEGKSSCLEKFNGSLHLKKTHTYQYQIQTQLLVTGHDYCDFVVWTEEDFFVQRITPDMVINNLIQEGSLRFFKRVVLPELVAKFFTRDSVVNKHQCVEPQSNVKVGDGCKRKDEFQTMPLDSKHRRKQTTRKSKVETPRASTSKEKDLEKYCFCHGRSRDKRMVACDAEDCPNKPFEWFHFSCVKLKEEPTGEWYCPDCQERQIFLKMKRGKKN